VYFSVALQLDLREFCILRIFFFFSKRVAHSTAGSPRVLYLAKRVAIHSWISESFVSCEESWVDSRTNSEGDPCSRD
jgi:hypothetical protein